MGILFQHKIFFLAVIITIGSFVGMALKPDMTDNFLTAIGTIWTSFVAAQLDMNKDKQ